MKIIKKHDDVRQLSNKALFPIFGAMIKRIALLLSFAVLFNAMQQTCIYLHFLCNQDYYANVLCENKAKPAMHCNGHCHMMKEMKEQEKQQDSPVYPVKSKFEEIQFLEKKPFFSFLQFSFPKKNNTLYITGVLSEISFSIFHPPTC